MAKSPYLEFSEMLVSNQCELTKCKSSFLHKLLELNAYIKPLDTLLSVLYFSLVYFCTSKLVNHHRSEESGCIVQDKKCDYFVELPNEEELDANFQYGIRVSQEIGESVLLTEFKI